MQRGQSSIEYVVAMAGLIIILIAIYEVSAGMGAQALLMQSQLEGERAAEQLASAIDAAAIAGPGTNVTVLLYTFPGQTLLVSGSEIIAQGEDGRTAAFVRHLDYVTTAVNLTANQSVRIVHDDTGLYVQGLG
jgi:hypothetical protein